MMFQHKNKRRDLSLLATTEAHDHPVCVIQNLPKKPWRKYKKRISARSQASQVIVLIFRLPQLWTRRGPVEAAEPRACHKPWRRGVQLIISVCHVFGRLHTLAKMGEKIESDLHAGLVCQTQSQTKEILLFERGTVDMRTCDCSFFASSGTTSQSTWPWHPGTWQKPVLTFASHSSTQWPTTM